MADTTQKQFHLEYPVSFGGETVTTLALRRPKGREIRAMQNGKGTPIDRTFEMMATLAEREVALIDELDAADVKKIDAWLNEIVGE